MQLRDVSSIIKCFPFMQTSLNCSGPSGMPLVIIWRHQWCERPWLWCNESLTGIIGISLSIISFGCILDAFQPASIWSNFDPSHRITKEKVKWIESMMKSVGSKICTKYIILYSLYILVLPEEWYSSRPSNELGTLWHGIWTHASAKSNSYDSCRSAEFVLICQLNTNSKTASPSEQ